MIIKKPNNKHLETAIDFLDNDNTIVVTKNRSKSIDSTYKSYISSFGGAIIQSGLMGTLMTFEANDKKKKIIHALFQLYNTNFPNDKINQINREYFRTVKTKNENEKK